MYRATLEVLELFRDGKQWTVAELAVLIGEGRARSALRILAGRGYVSCAGLVRESKYACAKVWARTAAEFPSAPLPRRHGAQALDEALRPWRKLWRGA